MSVYTYAPSDVQLLIGGNHIVHGVIEISAKKNSKTFEIVKGIRGKNTRKRNRDTSCEISVTLLQTSTSNDVLSEIVSLDAQLGTGRLSLQLKDSSGSTLIKSDDAFIEDYADITFQETIQGRTWNIQCLTTSIFVVGGNATRPSLLDSIANLF